MRLRRKRFGIDPNQGGIEPERWLRERFKILSFLSLAIHGGIRPRSLDPASERICRFLNPESCIRPSSSSNVSSRKPPPNNRTARLSQCPKTLRAASMFDRLLLARER